MVLVTGVSPGSPGPPVRRIGFAGAGRMGLPMMRRLVTTGHEVCAVGRTPERRAALAAEGVMPVERVVDAAEGVDAFIVCVFSDRQVQEVCLADGLFDAIPPGAALVVHTTVSPYTVREIAERGRALAIAVLDAPVSGGPHDITAGRLTVFAGGDEATVQRLRPVLTAYANPVLLVGPVGAGQSVKLVNNALFSAQLGLLTEAVRLGCELGVDEAVLLDALGHGSAKSRSLSGAASRGSANRFISDVQEFVDKDVTVVRQTADRLGARLGALEPALAALDQAGLHANS
ncbi:NAD(P)-dependent oxidoreductase [Streptomyces sp. 8P21H-1]|uniref:NAD(P)-dependent oxidoreductase n=1 Tax=Streptomyces sp. 8P21H-1 TaxID=2737048 RepID=UPI00156E77FD|nr:NAD(P)-dependent oxidoreductase [Streptomyces sp. 8P21H-1]NSL42688.1 NAD(P)-dependent oxidoreductase [Streptomyces sp. 8P21H-1]